MKFSDSSIGIYLEFPVKFLSFDAENSKLFYNENEEISFSTNLGTWATAKLTVEESNFENSIDDRALRIEKLKAVLLNNSELQGSDRQISELEFELSLTFVNLRNGIALNSSE